MSRTKYVNVHVMIQAKRGITERRVTALRSFPTQYVIVSTVIKPDSSWLIVKPLEVKIRYHDIMGLSLTTISTSYFWFSCCIVRVRNLPVRLYWQSCLYHVLFFYSHTLLHVKACYTSLDPFSTFHLNVINFNGCYRLKLHIVILNFKTLLMIFKMEIKEAVI